MFDYIKGTIAAIGENYLVVDKEGIGIRLFMNQRSLHSLQEEEEVKLYTHLVVREDDLYLNAFLSEEEREMYLLLGTVSGIGPKLALNILNGMEASSIQRAILTEDSNFLTQAPGVGKKTAQRMILELKDPLKKKGFVFPEEGDTLPLKEPDHPVVEALLSLGYQEREARQMTLGIDKTLSLADQIKAALKNR